MVSKERYSFANERTILFDPYMKPQQVFPILIRVDLGVMAMLEYSTFPKAPKLTFTLVSYSRGFLLEGRPYFPAEVQWAYSRAPVDKAE